MVDSGARDLDPSRTNFESFFLRLIRDMPARVWAKDSQGRYVFVNDEVVKVLRLGREKWIGSTDEALFPKVGQVYWRKDQQVLSSREPLVTTDQVGKDRYLFVLRFPLDMNGEPHVAAVGIETTSQISALIGFLHLQEQLFRNERLRSIGEMASGLAHDLNNSLNAASLRLRVLRRGASQEQVPDVDALERSIDAATQRVQNLREYVTSRREEDSQRVDLEELVSAAIEMVDFLIAKTPTINGGIVHIVRSAKKALPPVSVFPNQLKHVIANLLLNARDAMPDGGTITIGTRKTASSIEIVVSDQGSGIPKEQLEKIFEPFFTTKQNGTGLGLSMAMDVMTRMGGYVQVEDASPHGAVFTLRLPVREAD
jgi:signal transduction histidine kinase